MILDVAIWIVGILFALSVVILGADMLRFARAKKRADNPNEVGCDAGGVLYIKAGKTYYDMPNRKGTRKIADYAMDLRPGSVDMNAFTSLMNQAAKEHDDEVAKTKAEAAQNMRAVAKESQG